MRNLCAVFILFCLGCSGGFSIPGSSSSDGSRGGAGGGNGSFEALKYQGNIAGGPNDGILVVDINKSTGALILVLPLQLNPFVELAAGAVPGLPGAKFETYKDSKGKSYFALSVPLQYVLNGASFLPPARLPNGDPLPHVPGGELPSVAVQIPGKNNVKFHAYLGTDTVGVFFSSPYDPHLPIIFPIRNGTSDIGSFHAVPMAGEFNGGFFLITTLPTDVSAIIGDHFRF